MKYGNDTKQIWLKVENKSSDCQGCLSRELCLFFPMKYFPNIFVFVFIFPNILILGCYDDGDDDNGESPVLMIYWHNKGDDVNVDDDVDGDRGCCDDSGVDDDNDDNDGDDGDNDIGDDSGDDAIGITRCGVSILPLEPSARSNNGCICLNSLTHSFIHSFIL